MTILLFYPLQSAEITKIYSRCSPTFQRNYVKSTHLVINSIFYKQFHEIFFCFSEYELNCTHTVEK